MAGVEWSQENDLMLVEVYAAAAGHPLFVERPADQHAAVQVRGVILVPDDEVVFYVVSGPSAQEVRQAFEALGVPSVRIVPAMWVLAVREALEP